MRDIERYTGLQVCEVSTYVCGCVEGTGGKFWDKMTVVSVATVKLTQEKLKSQGINYASMNIAKAKIPAILRNAI